MLTDKTVLSFAFVMLTALFLGCEANICEYCEPNNPLKVCGSGLQCVGNMCIHPEGNVEGECCDRGPATCSLDYYCVYGICETTPIYPPPKEETGIAGDPFLLSTGTRIITPENPQATDETSALILQAQVEESLGMEIEIEPYEEGLPLENAIVLGTDASNPAVQTLRGALGLEIPEDGPTPAENYAFAISPNHILVAALESAGVLYGAQALKQLIRGESRRSPSGILDQVVVKDSPDVEMRGFTPHLLLYHNSLDNDGDGFKDPYKMMDVPVDLDVARSYFHVMSELRYNTVVLALGDIVTWSALPQPENTAFSVGEFLGLVGEANRYGLEIIPFLTGSSSSNGWIGTVDQPVEYTPDYIAEHDAENLVTTKAVIQEIIDAINPVQPVRYFHVGMDEDIKFGPRTLEQHEYWVDQLYDLLTANGVKTMLWHDTWIQTDAYRYDYSEYPEMHILVWDYSTPIPLTIRYFWINHIVSKGIEVSQSFLLNGEREDFQAWFSSPDPLKKGFICVAWNQEGTFCKEEDYEPTVNVNIRQNAHKCWNARTYP